MGTKLISGTESWVYLKIEDLEGLSEKLNEELKEYRKTKRRTDG